MVGERLVLHRSPRGRGECDGRHLGRGGRSVGGRLRPGGVGGVSAVPRTAQPRPAHGPRGPPRLKRHRPGHPRRCRARAHPPPTRSTTAGPTVAAHAPARATSTSADPCAKRCAQLGAVFCVEVAFDAPAGLTDPDRGQMPVAEASVRNHEVVLVRLWPADAAAFGVCPGAHPRGPPDARPFARSSSDLDRAVGESRGRWMP